ncbi:hypothetical protein BT96DRAFT_920441 [Gymnopus androsaceus JB14]|uniref:Uncharacterized protein n=1 Tax=Gymnopus androsaceus JB14 TaxID=1447944 RepID=A0A6A4HQA0_9AGAR|nr:hypothetical protein BT96DRAFT_920441 [Gymnopus androsaceus JB14]
MVNFDPFMAFYQRSSFSLIHLPTLLHLTLNDANVPTESSPITWQLIESPRLS